MSPSFPPMNGRRLQKLSTTFPIITELSYSCSLSGDESQGNLPAYPSTKGMVPGQNTGEFGNSICDLATS